MVVCLKREIWGEENYSKKVCKDRIMVGGGGLKNITGGQI